MKSIILLSTLMTSLGALAAPLPADTANPDGLCSVGTSAFGCTRPVTKRSSVDPDGLCSVGTSALGCTRPVNKRFIAWSPNQEGDDSVEVDAIKRSEVDPDGLCTVGTSAFGCSKPVTQ